MAGSNPESELGKIIHEEFLHCKICLSDFTTPKTLPCLHTFCHDCLDSYVKQTTGKTDIGGYYFLCPLCRKETEVPNTGVDGFATNFMISSLRDVVKGSADVSENKDDSTCGNCKEDGSIINSVAYCLDCKEGLCEPCAKIHCKTKVTRSHKVNKLESTREASLFCDINPKQKATLYCLDCNRTACFQCEVQHAKHSCCLISKAAEYLDVTIQSSLEQLQSSIKGLSLTKKDIEKEKEAIQSTWDRQIDQINDNYQAILDKLNQEKQLLTNEFDTHFEDQLFLYKELYNKVVSNIITLSRNMEVALGILDDSSKSTMSQKIDLVRNLQLLLSSEWNIPVHNLSLLPPKDCLEYKESTISTSYLGSSINKMNIADVREETIPSETIASSQSKCEMLFQFNTKVEADSETPFVSSIGLSNKEDVIYVSDWINSYVKMFRTNGFFMGFLSDSTHNIKNLDLHTKANGDVVVAYSLDHPGILKTFHYHGKFKNVINVPKISRRLFACRTPSDGYILTDEFKHMFYICDSDGQVIKQVKHGSLVYPCEVHADKTGKIYVSSCAKSVSVFDKDGYFLHCYMGRFGKFFPHHVRVDMHGNYLVADMNNNRIDLVSADGKFIKYVLTGDDGLDQPCALEFTSDWRLLVGQGNGIVKIYKYQE